MPFPEATRVIYKKNPLDQVICQLRFPPILKIDAEIPANFQEKIRKDFPNLATTSLWKLEALQESKGQIPPEVLRQALQSSGNKNYEFSSEDGQWKLNLTNAFIALTTNKYERWEKFKEKLLIPWTALVEIYSPAYFSRVGLRYIDVIRRSVLGLNNMAWHELIEPHLLGMVGAQGIRDQVQTFEAKYEIRLSDGESIVRVITKFVEPAGSSEICFMIDSDFFINKRIEIDAAMDKLGYFNQRATRLIRWSITDLLHESMEP